MSEWRFSETYRRNIGVISGLGGLTVTPGRDAPDSQTHGVDNCWIMIRWNTQAWVSDCMHVLCIFIKEKAGLIFITAAIWFCTLKINFIFSIKSDKLLIFLQSFTNKWGFPVNCSDYEKLTNRFLAVKYSMKDCQEWERTIENWPRLTKKVARGRRRLRNRA